MNFSHMSQLMMNREDSQANLKFSGSITIPPTYERHFEMKRDSCYTDKGSAGTPSGVIICDISYQGEESLSQTSEIVRSPIVCFDRCIEEQPKLIIVRFDQEPSKDRTYLLELCTALKRNGYSRHCHLLALLPNKHRQLLEELAKAGVDYVWFEDEDRLDDAWVNARVDKISIYDSPERRLTPLCPFIHYKKLSDEHEMTVCRAYLDRLVLAGKRLHELCETDAHHKCGYYQKPRQKS